MLLALDHQYISYRVRSTSGDSVNLGVIIPGYLVDLGGVQRGFLHIVIRKKMPPNPKF